MHDVLRRSLLLAALYAEAMIGHAQAAPDPPAALSAITAGISGSWAYIGGDEFNGTALDTAKWNIGHWYERADLDIATHVVSDGYLKLYPKIGRNGKLISRTLNTDGKFYLPNTLTYYVEFMARLPAGRGRWPALWLFAHNDTRNPARPELDIMETGTSLPWGDGQKPVSIKATSWTDKGLNQTTGKVVNQDGQGSSAYPVTNLTTQDHLFAAKVDPRLQTITYYADGEPFAQHRLNSTRERLYLVISDQYDGSFNSGMSADPTTTEKAAIPFMIDYVRVFVSN